MEMSTPQQNRCCQCHRTFDDAFLMQVDEDWVCAHCKPGYLQRFREGVALLDATVEVEVVHRRSMGLGFYMPQTYRFRSTLPPAALREVILGYYQFVKAELVESNDAQFTFERRPPLHTYMFAVKETGYPQTITITLEPDAGSVSVTCHYRIRHIVPFFCVVPPHHLETEVRELAAACEAGPAVN